MAEGILKRLLAAEAGGAKGDSAAALISVSSAGTGALVGFPAALEAVTVSQEAGIDIISHRARQLSAEMLLDGDLVLTMEIDQRKVAVGLLPQAAGKIHCLSVFAGEQVAQDVADPIGRGMKAYREAQQRICDLLQKALPKILQQASQSR